MHLVIIGHRGSGKSTLGHAVAVRLGSAFVDLDDAALSRFRTPSVTEVWRTHGEQAWREAEAAALADLHLERPTDLEAPPLVIALGGGTPAVPAAQETLRRVRASRSAFVVWLRAPVEAIVDRLNADPGDRPTLAAGPVADGDEALHHRTLLAQREPIYAALADVVIDATRPAAEGAQAIIDAWLAAHQSPA